MKLANVKQLGIVSLFTASVLYSGVSQADFWEKAKETASGAWDATTETVGEWTDKASESETYADVKEGAGEIADKATDKETYINAWESVKETAVEAKYAIKDSMESDDK